MGGVEAVEKPLAVSDDRSTVIIRGKRTKRQRTPSSCGGGAAAASSSSVSVGGSGGDYDLSPASSSGTTVFQSTEEEEDLAYCLILLAQGPRRQTDEDDVDAKLGSVELFRSSKKFSEVATAGGAAATKGGFFVYECKTCCRTFPSFQALGGHRASHKKPRPAEGTKKSPSEPNSDEDEEEGQIRKIAVGPPACSSPNYPTKVLQSSKPKIHECSICGSEFSSGQALGGHMRRHRAAAAPATSSGHVATSLNSVTTEHRHDSAIVGEDGSRGVILSLDLNLPAPEDDRKFQFAAAPAQKPLLFSAPALVDCHY